MLKDFHAFQKARDLYQICKGLKLPRFLKDQLLRASSSVALNIAEGSGKRTPSDQKRFYFIALGSLRECEAIFELECVQHPQLLNVCNQLGAILFKLCHK
ncbi:MAG TPA: four helix bundle protein [Bdellovibrionota bacterium]|nr:four helix bundle protein [Bdellovibrionota bacterium]